MADTQGGKDQSGDRIEKGIGKDYKQALEWYEKYLKLAAKGSKGYDFATQSVKYIKGELFMEEK